MPTSHRGSLPAAASTDPLGGGSGSFGSGGRVYCFVDIGMREVCQSLMVESQKRQIRL